MKLFAAISFALACTASASTLPRSVSEGRQLRTQSDGPLNHWVAKPLAKESFPVVAVETRGGHHDEQLATYGLWASCGFNVIVALAAAFKPALIGDILMTSGGGATAWCCHLLAIASAGSAVFTYLVIKDPSHDVVKIASKANIVAMGAACVYAAWQYAQSVFDNQNCLGFVACTGIITGVLAKATYC